MFQDSLIISDTIPDLHHKFTLTGILVENQHPGISIQMWVLTEQKSSLFDVPQFRTRIIFLSLISLSFPLELMMPTSKNLMMKSSNKNMIP